MKYRHKFVDLRKRILRTLFVHLLKFLSFCCYLCICAKRNSDPIICEFAQTSFFFAVYSLLSIIQHERIPFARASVMCLQKILKLLQR